MKSRLANAVVLTATLVVFAGVLAQPGSAGHDLWNVSSPAVWSPDGTAVAWGEVSPAGTRYRIEVAAATAMATPHTIYSSKPFPGGCCSPLTWTASGRILYIANFTLFSIPATGGNPEVLFHGSTSQYIVTPDGRTVAVVDGCDCGHAPDKIAFVDLGSGRTSVLPVAKNVSDDPVSFSPDGGELIFQTDTLWKNGEWNNFHGYMAVPSGGGTPVPLADSGLPGARFVTAQVTSPRWSPDGNWIAAWFNTTGRLVTINTQTGRMTYAAPPHTEGWAASWSPDASRLAYAATLRLGNNAQFAPATVQPDGTGRDVFWNRSSNLYYRDSQGPAWSPDSSKLLFWAQHGESGPVMLMTAAADGGHLTQIH